MGLGSHPVRVLYTAAQIENRITFLSAEIARTIAPDTLVISLLRGSFIFTADLIRALHTQGIRPRVDFMSLSSYGAGTESSGTITVDRDLKVDVAGQDVLIVDDILETGRTLDFACSRARERGASVIRTAVLLDKPGKRAIHIQADFVGFTIPDHFVVGYGLDYGNYYRELPYIGALEMG